MLALLGNVIWLIFGGIYMAFGWYLTGLFMLVSIIGIPWVRSCFVIGNYCLWPFGSEIKNRRDISGRNDIGTGLLGLLGNIIWVVCCGFWLALGHLISAFLCFVTIIGIPFGFVHLKLVRLSFAPVGLTVVPKES